MAGSDSSSVQTSGSTAPPERLLSLDAYRGFIMLAMASSALGFTAVRDKLKEQTIASGQTWSGFFARGWDFLAYQFEHVEWTGCSFWDLIQPSFMFMVGVAMPFSDARRLQAGQTAWRRWGHTLWRSLVLIALGVFLSSNGEPFTRFTFVNVLTQIGLGYPFLYALRHRPWKALVGVVAVLLFAYWGWFATYATPDDEAAIVKQSLVETHPKRKKVAIDEREWSQFTGFASHWNKHLNAASAVDRTVLNWFPRREEPFHGRRFWFNDGGYATLNFIPSLATMILGLIAGQVLRSDRSPKDRWRWLMQAGFVCFALIMAIDTTIWPIQFPTCSWTLCPSVKRIWTPTWAIFSSGWTFWILASFYGVIDICQWHRWSWPLVVVGMNSIAMYCMSQLLRPWVKGTLKTHLSTIDAWFDWKQGIAFHLFDPQATYSPIWERLLVLFAFWLACLWLYRKKIFLRV